MPDGLTLITPTGGRPEAFGLCCEFIRRQTYIGPLQWLVVDDVRPPTAFPGEWMASRPNTTGTNIFPVPSWSPGQNTLARNLLAAIPEVAYDRILFLEDDDRYPSDHLETMATRLDVAAIVGDSVSRYYHLPSRRYRLFRNQQMASLCQTGMRAELLPLLKQVCQASPDFIDMRLWRAAKATKDLQAGPPSCIGIKGLPGRAGIGAGHRPDRSPEWLDDKDLSVLRGWIGNDISLYEKYL